MTSAIKLGSDIDGKPFTMPADFITQTCGIIARKGAGKTYTGAVAAEEMLEVGAQVVIIDPLDVWWGLRSSASGKSNGFAVVVFGGEHGDLPLLAESGSMIADLVVEHRLSAVLSLDHLSKNGQRQFMTAFAEQLYQRKNPSNQRTPVHLFIDEADMFCPQRVQHGQERMLGAVDSLVRRGRTRGIGVTMITQRPATIHKDVFTQIEVLIALQLTSPQDRHAVDEWVKGNDTQGHRDKFMASLASLKVGQAWIWSPSWLQCFSLIQVRKRHTFNSSATPKAGEQIQAPTAAAAVDLDALRGKLATVIKTAEQNDPTKLKKRIDELEQKIRAAGNATPAPSPQALMEAEQRGRMLERASLKRLMQGPVSDVEIRLASANKALDPLRAIIGQVDVAPKPIAPRQAPAPAPARSKAARPADDGSMTRAERAILIAAVQREPRHSNRVQLSVLSGYSVTSSSFANAMGALRTKGYLTGGGDDNRATPEGIVAAGDVPPIPDGDERVRWWIGQLNRAEGAMLKAIADRFPNAIDKADLSAASGYSETSSSFANALGRLRSLGLISGRGDLQLNADVMESA